MIMREQLNYDVIILDALKRAMKHVEPFEGGKPFIQNVDGEFDKDGNGIAITVTFRNGAKIEFNPNNIVKEPDEQPLSIGGHMVRRMFENAEQCGIGGNMVRQMLENAEQRGI